jgi:hypothetical protein
MAHWGEGRGGLDRHLQVTAGGLHSLADRCETLAGRLASRSATTTGPASNQTSVAAVATCDEQILTAGVALATWTSATARTLNAAAGAYERADTESAGELGITVI